MISYQILLCMTTVTIAVANQGNQISSLPLMYQSLSQQNGKSHDETKKSSPNVHFIDQVSSSKGRLNPIESNAIDDETSKKKSQDNQNRSPLTSPLGSKNFGVPFWSKSKSPPANDQKNKNRNDQASGSDLNRKIRNNGPHPGGIPPKVANELYLPPSKGNDRNDEQYANHIRNKKYFTGKMEDITDKLANMSSNHLLYNPRNKKSSDNSIPLQGHSRANSQTRRRSRNTKYRNPRPKDTGIKDKSEKSDLARKQKVFAAFGKSEEKLLPGSDKPRESIQALMDKMKGRRLASQLGNRKAGAVHDPELYDRRRKWNQDLPERIREYRKNLMMKHETLLKDSRTVHSHIVGISTPGPFRALRNYHNELRDNSHEMDRIHHPPRPSTQSELRIAQRRLKLKEQLSSLIKRNREGTLLWN